MPKRLSTIIGVSHDKLEATGAFDSFIDIDSVLHIDPHLLDASSAPEMRAGSRTFTKYWKDTAKLLRLVKSDGDVFSRESLNRFVFREIPNLALGYSDGHTSGTGIGVEHASALYSTGLELVRAGIEDPTIFELIGLLDDGIGPDRISDMTISITLPHILEYTGRICKQVNGNSQLFEVVGQQYRLPKNPNSGRFALLVPRDVLRPLPVAFDWTDVDKVCAYADEVRDRVNAEIGTTWKQATKEVAKEELKRVLLENPEAIRDLITQYKDKPRIPYDFNEDIRGERIWLEVAHEFATNYPLHLLLQSPKSIDDVLAIAQQICEHFRKLVEENGLSEWFWTDSGRVRHERFPQMLFFAIADAYCKANNIDLSPETNSGRGPIDFKLSTGYDARVLVEVKWSSNSKLRHGYERQLETYAAAEQTSRTIYLVIRVTDSIRTLENVQRIRAERVHSRIPSPEVIVVDGRKRPSASQA